MNKTLFIILITIFYFGLTMATINVESETGLNVYHDGTCERVGSLKFIVFNGTDFQSAIPSDPVFIKVKLTDAAVLCRDLDGNNSVGDGVNWVGVETDGTVNGFAYGDVLIRGAQGQDFIEIMILNAPGSGGNLPNSTNQAWFRFGSTLDSSGNNFTVNVYDFSSPTTVLRTLDFGTPLCIDYSGRVNGEDKFLPNEINYVVLESYQGSIGGQPLGVGFSPPNPAIAYGNEFSPNISFITASANEFGTISPEGEIPVESGFSKEFIFLPNSGYHIKNIIVDDIIQSIASSYTFYSVTSNHTIYVEFSINNPPIINSFTADFTSGNIPLTVNFMVDAENPKGGSIDSYNWDFDGDGTFDSVTIENATTYTYTTAGIYNAKVKVVDDELETTTSNSIKIETSKEIDFYLPKELSGSSLTCINPFNDGGYIYVKGTDSTGLSISEQNYPILCNGKISIDLSNTLTNDVESFKVSSDRRILFFIDGSYENGKFASYINTNKYKELKIPHVAEEVNQWDTHVFISNSYKSPLKLNTRENENEIEKSTSFFCNLNYYFQENTNKTSWFGDFDAYSTNPFSNSYSLSGFEYFSFKDGDGAAVELSGNLSTDFYIPHLTTNKDIFWTGFVFTNFSTNEVTLNVDFYLNSGELAGSEEISIPSNTKLKGTTGDLFPSIPDNAEWGIVHASNKIQAIEIYGTYSNGICGFSLNNTTTTNGVFPLMLKGQNVWTGIALCNPNTETAEIKLKVMSHVGNLKETVETSLLPFSKFSATIEEIFQTDIITSDYILIESTLPITGIEAAGDLDRNYMKALTMSEK